MTKFDDIFYNDTFLYADASTDIEFEGSRSKKLFIFKHSIGSQSKLLKRLKSG
ncbi:hypothetical protein [Flexistipes sinusarabici]|uniref:hypothetical protein n=1 Tax=Flexistipes sinusarabici TaxID=2352 RepID=UPI0026F0D21B|nr:hypothetical protein [Flexistipes sinusarabici]